MDTATTFQHYALGIDVAKDTLELALITPEGHTHTKNVRNDEQGYKALLACLGGLAKKQAKIYGCLEASGGYEEEAALYLHAAGMHVSLVNPRAISAYAKARLSRAKTDRADAALIARYCQREQPALWQPPAPAERQLRDLTRAIEALKRERDRTKNRRDSSANEQVRLSLDEVIRLFKQQITALEKQIEAHLKEHPTLRAQRDLLMTIPGVGATTAAVVLSELGDTSRFESARQAAAYAGLVPRPYEWGGSVRQQTRLSKLGNGRLRKALYFPAMTALRCNEAVQVFGEGLAARGKAKKAIIGAAMRKLLHICFGVLKNGQPFNASFHLSA